jgi:hypothetical protein
MVARKRIAQPHTPAPTNQDATKQNLHLNGKGGFHPIHYFAGVAFSGFKSGRPARDQTNVS